MTYNYYDALREQIYLRLDGRFTIGHGNRTEASILHLYDVGAIPKLDHFFTAVAGGGIRIAETIHAMEDEMDEHPDLVWGHQPYWQMLDELCGRHPDAVIMVTYRRSEHEQLIENHPGILITCPPQPVAAAFEDKAIFHEILTEAGVENTLPTLVFEDAAEIPSYNEMVEAIGSEDLVLQVVASAGGARVDLQSSICFVQDEEAFEDGKKFQGGFGPIKVVQMVWGSEANGAGCALPWGTYVDPPSHKPVGMPELYGRPGSGAGNDWTYEYPADQVAVYSEMLQLVGAEAARRGFLGCFGVDSLFPEVWPHEINGRSQGTTELQEQADFRAGIPSLPMMALAHSLGVPREYFPDPDEYNEVSLHRLGGWYLKVVVPESIVIPQDLNGLWRLQDGELVARRVASGLLASPSELYIYAAPQAGKLANPGSGLPTLYLNGFGQPVFTPDDQLTEFGDEARCAVYHALGFKDGEF